MRTPADAVFLMFKLGTIRSCGLCLTHCVLGEIPMDSTYAVYRVMESLVVDPGGAEGVEGGGGGGGVDRMGGTH